MNLARRRYDKGAVMRGYKNALNSRRSLEQRILMRNRGNLRAGMPEGWADEALDYYLSGVPVSEIAKCYGVCTGTVFTAIPKAALFRLMLVHRVEHMDQLDELMNEKT